MSKWEMVKLGDVATYINGFPFKPDQWSDKGLPIIRIQNLNNANAMFNYYDSKIKEKYFVSNGDVLVSWSASLGVFKWNRGKALVNQHIFKVVFDKIEIDKDFFIYTVGRLLEEMGRQTHGSTMKHITKGNFDNMLFRLPPLETQKQIAKTLDTAAELLAMRKQQLAELNTLIGSTFHNMFGDPVSKPMGWDIVRLHETSVKITDGTHQSPKFIDNGIPFLFISNIVDSKIDYNTEKFISEEDYNKLMARTPIEVGDILYTIVGSYGNPAIVQHSRKFCFQRHIAYIKPNRACINSTYLFGALLSDHVKAQVEKRVRGLAQKTLNLSELKEIEISLPPKHLQTQFATVVTKIEEQKALVKKAIAETQYLFDSLMSEYFE